MDRLNTETIAQFKSDFISSNNMGTALLVILALYREDYNLLDELDDSNKDKKMILLYRDLVYKGYLTENEDNEDSTNVHFSLTKKSIDLLKNDIEVIPEIFKEKESTIVEVLVDTSQGIPTFFVTKKEESDDVETWISRWVEMFPVRRADNYPLRNKGVCLNKMKIFLKMPEHSEYTKDVIFKATKLYIDEQYANGLKYTLIAGNFIYKGEKGRGSVKDSTLAMYCDIILNGGGKPSPYQDMEDNNPFL